MKKGVKTEQKETALKVHKKISAGLGFLNQNGKRTLQYVPESIASA